MCRWVDCTAKTAEQRNSALMMVGDNNYVHVIKREAATTKEKKIQKQKQYSKEYFPIVRIFKSIQFYVAFIWGQYIFQCCEKKIAP